jgi:hypothetical protein
MKLQVVTSLRSQDSGERYHCAYNIFRRKQDPELCCAVPEHQPVPAFLIPEEWEFAAKATHPANAPRGFRLHAARAGERFNGFYVFQAR